MNRKIFAIAWFALATGAAGGAQSANDSWVGIWHANVGARPTSLLTLATDTGKLGGTLVLDMLCCDGDQTPHVIASDPHLLMDPVADGKTLTFRVRMHRPDGANVIASFEVKRTAPGKATIHCVSCGADAPVVELVKGP